MIGNQSSRSSGDHGFKYVILFFYGIFNAVGAIHFLKQGKSETDALLISGLASMIVASICFGIYEKFATRRTKMFDELD